MHLSQSWLFDEKHARWRALALRIVVSASLIALLFYFVDVKQAVMLVLRASPGPVAAAVALLLLRVPLMAWRWQIILAQLGASLRIGALTRILYVSAFLGAGLPTANGGDLVRGGMLKQPGISLDVVIGSILADRFYGILSMAFLALPGAMVIAAHGASSAATTSVMAVSAALILLTLALPALLPLASHRRLSASNVNRFVARAARAAANLGQAFNYRSLFGCMILSLVSQTMGILSVACAGWAVHAGEPLASYFALVPVVWIVTMLPLSISGLGVREAGFAFLFSSIGSSYEHGVAIGAIASATGIVAAMLGAVALRTAARKIDAAGAPDSTAAVPGPLLVIAGMPRTGTTTLYRNFERHPGFTVPLRKELNHFLSDAPAAAYRTHFPYWQPDKICLDVSPFYSLDPMAVRRLHDAAPQARVVLLIREPARWLYSIYVQTCSFTPRPPAFADFVRDPWMPLAGKPVHFSLDGGFYQPTIARFAQAFGDQLLVADFAAFEKAPLAMLQQIERFAGAGAYFTEQTIDASRNNSGEQAQRASPLLRRLLASDFVIRAGLFLVPPSVLRRVRAAFYYSTKPSHTDPSPANLPEVDLQIGLSVTRADAAYYAGLFRAGPIRLGSTLV